MILGPRRGSADIILSLGATRCQQVQRVDLSEDSTGYRVLTFYNPDVWRHISMLWEHLSPPGPQVIFGLRKRLLGASSSHKRLQVEAKGRIQ